jgi:hypothetical protein
MANFEEISVNPSDSSNPPAKGDRVRARVGHNAKYASVQ